MIYLSIAILILSAGILYKSRLKQADLRFQQEYIFVREFVYNSKINEDSYNAIKIQLSKIIICGKPQLRLMLRLRNDFVKKFKKYVDAEYCKLEKGKVCL